MSLSEVRLPYPPLFEEPFNSTASSYLELLNLFTRGFLHEILSQHAEVIHKTSFAWPYLFGRRTYVLYVYESNPWCWCSMEKVFIYYVPRGELPLLCSARQVSLLFYEANPCVILSACDIFSIVLKMLSLEAFSAPVTLTYDLTSCLQLIV